MDDKQQTSESLDLLWGASEIAQAIGANERMAFHYLQTGQLPARKVGRMWVVSRAALRRHFLVEEEA